jgi:hypothetical protein
MNQSLIQQGLHTEKEDRLMSDNIFNTRRQSRGKREQNLAGSLPFRTSVSETARTITAVMPNGFGRLSYLATEWNARSVDNSFIPAGTIVRPVMRKGNTWYVQADSGSSEQQAA